MCQDLVLERYQSFLFQVFLQLNASNWNSEQKALLHIFKRTLQPSQKRLYSTCGRDETYNVNAVSLLWSVSLTLSGAFKRGSCSVTRSRVHGKGGGGGGGRGGGGRVPER